MTNRKRRAHKQNSSVKQQPSNNNNLVMAQFSGPLPPPELFNAYEQILPGCADRIVKLAEREQKQQHGIQNQVVAANVNAEKLGMLLGFSFQVAVIAGLFIIAAVLLLKGKDITGLVALFTAVAGSGAFVYQSTRNSGSASNEGKKPEK